MAVLYRNPYNNEVEPVSYLGSVIINTHRQL